MDFDGLDAIVSIIVWNRMYDTDRSGIITFKEFTGRVTSLSCGKLLENIEIILIDIYFNFVKKTIFRCEPCTCKLIFVFFFCKSVIISADMTIKTEGNCVELISVWSKHFVQIGSNSEIKKKFNKNSVDK